MAAASARILGKRLTTGVIIVKEGHSVSERDCGMGKIALFEAAHPVPDQRGAAATLGLIKLLEQAGPEDLVICLISGGGSALLTAPAPGLDLYDLQALTRSLLASGADINQINTLRKHLDEIKGGGLARLAAPATVITLILSDVVGDSLDIIASGPTVPDPSTFAQAWQILEQYRLLEQTPPAILNRLERGRKGLLPDTPKPGDALFNRVQNLIVGSNRQAAHAAEQQALAEGIHPFLLTTSLRGEARQAGRALAGLAQQLSSPTARDFPQPSCLICGGETTVTLQGSGLGGRNQELALAAVEGLAGLDGFILVTLATDGGDGPTPAAGAVVTDSSLSRAQRLRLVPAAFLEKNDSYHFFQSLDDLLMPGPTLTNVNDLTFLFSFGR
jgi:glycerate 2-kinase